MQNRKYKLELADVFSSQETSILESNKFCSNQKKAFSDIISCRTAKLGGHKMNCNSCKYVKQAYNSCRNRHCNKCQFVRKAQWVDKLASNLPPVKQFHLVFTIPTCLHPLFLLNQAKAYDLLFKAAGESLMQVAQNTKYLGAQAGAVAVLHTWGQTLTYHPHIHMIVPAGGLNEDATEWIPSSKKFIVPVKVLSLIFRALLCKHLEKAINIGKIKLPKDVGNFKEIKDVCYKTNWVVYAEKPFSCPDNLINYLANYTHRVAISNERLMHQDENNVTFSYKDYKKAGIKRTITLDKMEFIRRFLQHVLPSGFCKIRYFGFMAICNIKTRLNECFKLINKVSFFPSLVGLNAFEVLEILTNKDPFCCPKCKKGKLIPILAKPS
jgi:hypothetical protein